MVQIIKVSETEFREELPGTHKVDTLDSLLRKADSQEKVVEVFQGQLDKAQAKLTDLQDKITTVRALGVLSSEELPPTL